MQRAVSGAFGAASTDCVGPLLEEATDPAAMVAEFVRHSVSIIGRPAAPDVLSMWEQAFEDSVFARRFEVGKMKGSTA